MDFHTLANIFPIIDGNDFKRLCVDIEKNGQHEPIVIYEGKILDGRNRWNACEQIGVECEYLEYDGNDPLAYVISLNLHRRHLNESQRSMVAARIAGLKPGRPSRKSPIGEVKTQSEAADALNVGKRSVERAQKVQEKGTEELVAAVDRGDVAVSAAVQIAELPKADQKKALRSVNPPAEARRIVRKKQAKELEKNQSILKTKKKASMLLADPPWQYEYSKSESRAIENQYPTMELDEICALPIHGAIEPDCTLFMWATSPKLTEALKVIESWGFLYRTCAVWDKEKIGMGYYFRQQHELLLVATRGKPRAPDPESRVSSVFREKRGRHSEKPQCIYEALEKMYAGKVKLEMFCRKARKGWQVWGNESDA